MTSVKTMLFILANFINHNKLQLYYFCVISIGDLVINLIQCFIVSISYNLF